MPPDCSQVLCVFPSIQEISNLRLKPAKNSCTVLTLDEDRSDVLGVMDGSTVIGHDEKKKKLAEKLC